MEKYRYPTDLHAALERMRQPFAVYQFLEKRVVSVLLSEGFCELFGYDDRAQAYYDMDHDMYKDTHPDDVARIADAAHRFALEGGRYEVIYRSWVKKSASYHVVHAIGEHVHTDEGVRLAQVWYTDEGVYADSSTATGMELSQTLSGALHEESILKASYFDYLTGLPSMSYFFELADSRKNAILSGGGHPALLYMDFSGMKFFNTKHGFAAGDKMLQAFARLLIRSFDSENCCRIGADHFAVVTEEEGLEERLRALFRAWEDTENGRSLPVHVGIYQNQSEKLHISGACDRAKLACVALRGTYASCFGYYRQELRDDAVRRQYIIENIDRAIAERWVQVYYQPIIRAVNGRVSDDEALARWVDPVQGFLSPADFIPALEEAGLIYKLDLYVLEQILEKIKILEAAGLYVVPQSVNLSRSDFEACDIVEEIRRRVDAAGVKRDRITIEITESIIGSNFEFMKAQIARFRELGFPVWMDDFGSGYSSLDVLQSIRFDLLKFDMSFMRKLDEGTGGKIILTELMKMASSLGVDTVCEGVETAEQARFLQEIGCSKLQGFFFSRPVPLQSLLNWHLANAGTGYENPAESEYCETVGSVNLYDLSVIGAENDSSFHNAFNTLPMGVIEVRGNATRFVRSNQSYRDFIKRFFGHDLSRQGDSFVPFGNSFTRNVVKTCCEQGTRSFYDEKMPDGSIVHSFARQIARNPIDGTMAVVIAVLSVQDPDEGESYADIARALAADYHNIYVVDLDTERFIEYSSPVGGQELAMERHGEDFFAAARQAAETRIYAEDRTLFLASFSKERILRALDEQSSYSITCRLIDTGAPVYASLKITRMPGGNRLIVGISIIEAQMRQKKRQEEMQKEREALVRVMALSDGYMSLFTVDPETEHYIEYSSTDDFASLGTAKEGEAFFRQSRIDAEKYFYPADVAHFQAEFTKENVMRAIRTNGNYRIQYRLMIRGKPRPVALKVARFREGDEEKLVVGVRAWKKRDAESASAFFDM